MPNYSLTDVGNLNARLIREETDQGIRGAREVWAARFPYDQRMADINFGHQSQLQNIQNQGALDRTRVEVGGNQNVANIQSMTALGQSGINAAANRYSADRQYDAAALSARTNLQAIREKGRTDLETARLSADASRYGSQMQYQGVLENARANRDAANIQAGATYAQIGSNERISAAEIAQARERMQMDRELGLADIAQKYFGAATNMFSASMGGNNQLYSNFLANSRGF